MGPPSPWALTHSSPFAFAHLEADIVQSYRSLKRALGGSPSPALLFQWPTSPSLHTLVPTHPEKWPCGTWGWDWDPLPKGPPGTLPQS